MKLVFIAPSAYLLGGVQDWLYMLTLALRARGHDVIVGVPDGIFHKAEKYNIHYPGINALSFKNKSGSHEGRIRALTKFLLRNPSNIIIGVNIGDLYEAYRRYSMRFNHTYLVMTLHAIEPDYLEDIHKYSDLLDSVVTTNRLTQRIVIDKGFIDKKRVFYAPYGVETNVSTTTYTQNSQLRIAWAGRIDDDQKRVSDIRGILLNLDKLSTDYCLSIAGVGPYHKHLQEELSYWIEQRRVYFYGLLSKKELPKFYSENNILLITSEWETGPIVAWEAMVAGLVVVSSNYVGCASEKALIDGSTALLYPTGSHELAAKQLFRLSDPGYRNFLAANAKRMVHIRYSKEACISQWETTLENILKHLTKKEAVNFLNKSLPPSGKLESILGLELSETLRALISWRSYCYDPGSEWPHSLHGQSDQKALLEYAKHLESNG
jgi:glycosyltransferase involved in cell wall biosynthesis